MAIIAPVSIGPPCMTRLSQTVSTRLLSAALFTIACLAMPATGEASANDLYRIELIVFRNLDVDAQPDQVQQIRRFFETFELDADSPSPAPVALEKADGSFANIWTRLERLADYEPLIRLTFEQTMFDYHPAVRVNNETVMGRELHFPADIIYLDLTEDSDTLAGQTRSDPLEDYVQALYQLDGSLRMRRSRFLHIDLDLEFRLPGPAWDREFPVQPVDLLEPGFQWLGEAPGPVVIPPDLPVIAASDVADPDITLPIVEPFELYRLQQSRQIKSNTLQYFDSAFLGAIVRVTPIAAETP